MSRASSLAVVDAYRLERDPRAWMTGLLETAGPALGRGSGLVGVSYRVEGGVRLTSEIVSVGEIPDEGREDFRRVALSRPPREVAASWGAPEALALSSLVFDRVSGSFEEWDGFDWMRRMGFVDSLAVKAPSTRPGAASCSARRYARGPPSLEARSAAGGA